MKSKMHLYVVFFSVYLQVKSVSGTAILAIFCVAHFYRIEVRYQCALSTSVDKRNDEFEINK